MKEYGYILVVLRFWVFWYKVKLVSWLLIIWILWGVLWVSFGLWVIMMMVVLLWLICLSSFIIWCVIRLFKLLVGLLVSKKCGLFVRVLVIVICCCWLLESCCGKCLVCEVKLICLRYCLIWCLCLVVLILW